MSLSHHSEPPVDLNRALGGNEHNEESIFTFVENMLGVVRRHLWLTVSLCVTLPIVGLSIALQKPIVHAASATLLLEARPPRIVDKATEVVAEESMSDIDRFPQSQLRVLESTPMAEKVEQRLHLSKGSTAGRLDASFDRFANVFTLRIVDPDPVVAVQLVNAYVETYIESTIMDRVGVATNAADFLSAESGNHRKELEAAEEDLYKFHRSNELPASSFEDSHKIHTTTLQALHERAAAAKAENIHLAAQLKEVQAASKDRDLKRHLTVKDGRVELLSRRVTILESLTQAEQRYGAQHPKVIELRETLAQTEQALDSEVKTTVEAMQARERANLSELAQLETSIANETRKAVTLRQKELEYNRLKRKVEEDREAYSALARRLREIEVQAMLRQTYVRKLDPATVGAIDRGVSRHMGLGLLLGLVIGLVLSFLLDFLDDTFRSPDAVEAALRQPLLGAVPSIPAPTSLATPAEVEIARAEHIFHHPRSMVSEQCHSLATNLLSLFLEKPPKALMVVSSSVEDGKTMLALNLAITFANRGKRILLVDADLRRGRLHKVFGLSRSGGLFELVTQKIGMDSALRKTFIPNMDVLTTGEVPKKVSPLRILELGEMATTVATLKEHYDLIVFDTAPVPLVSDAMLLGGFVDGAVAVLRTARSSRRLARKLAEHIQFARINLLGWVLNDVPEGVLDKKYYYRYGYREKAYFSEEKAVDQRQ